MRHQKQREQYNQTKLFKISSEVTSKIMLWGSRVSMFLYYTVCKPVNIWGDFCFLYRFKQAITISVHGFYFFHWRPVIPTVQNAQALPL